MISLASVECLDQQLIVHLCLFFMKHILLAKTNFSPIFHEKFNVLKVLLNKNESKVNSDII